MSTVETEVFRRALNIIEQYQIEIREAAIDQPEFGGFCEGEWFRDEALAAAKAYEAATGDGQYVRRITWRCGEMEKALNRGND